jgi:acyl-CoA thioester hydrolase
MSLQVPLRPAFDMGRASLTIRQRAGRQSADGPVLLCEGSICIGWVDAARHRPLRIPPTALEALT